ncbi:fatty-acid amide hydrolase 2-like [Paramacrobiotus metropolitanus]|uniref:fatty-acid amide hydrolase 2-like n=1 Tax=Paramacrobiotus metropolitanus TaxID=2943436 RepID=UPI00244643B6|nr:fatty-acid amide hydrolase 2-like [Paramacrobiotus metropolitanus]
MGGKIWSWKDWLVCLLRLYMDIVSDFLFGVYNRIFGSTQRLPPIRSDLLRQSATALVRRIRAGELTSADVVEAYIQRIRDVNPAINAVVAERFEAARADARELDRRLRDTGFENLDDGEFSEARKPLLGVPITVKECLQVQGMPQTAGAVARKHVVAEADAEAVHRLRSAGAIVLALTNICEICMWWETDNKVYGRTRNPYGVNRSVGGSSGGEGAIIAAAGSPCGIGSDIGGSIRIPSFFCGVFGHKPTRALTPLTGMFPESSENTARFNTVGPLCRYAEDLQPFYKVVLGPEAKTLSLDTMVDLSKLRLHYILQIEHPFVTPVRSYIKGAVRKAVNHLATKHRAKIIPESQIKDRLEAFCYTAEFWTAEVIHDPNHSFSADMLNGVGKLQPRAEFFRWIRGRSEHTLPAILLAAMEQATPTDQNRKHWSKVRDDLEKEIVDILGNDGILIMPTHPRTAPYQNQPKAMHLNTIYTTLFNALGLPVTHVPMGRDGLGLPYGIQIISSHYNDHLTLAVACELEKTFGGWREPT